MQRLAFTPVARILLLGSTGFFGRGVAHKLIDGGHQLRVLVRDPMKAAAFKVRGAQVMVGDALNPAAVTQAAQGVEHIISLVAVRRNRPQSFLEVNVDGPRILGQAARAAGVQSVVFVSAIGARLDAHYKYLTSRWMGEQELAKSGVAGTILRFSFVLAEEGGVLNDFERAANFGPFLIIPGNGQTQMQPILREDAARCVVETIGRQELLGKIVELGGPEVVTYETMFDWFIQARGIKKRKLKVPVSLLIPGAIVMEALSTNPVATADEINTIQLPNVADGIDSVSTRYGWRPSAPSTWAPQHWTKAPARR
jgi:NADH dehydrogenase